MVFIPSDTIRDPYTTVPTYWTSERSGDGRKGPILDSIRLTVTEGSSRRSRGGRVKGRDKRKEREDGRYDPETDLS